MTNADFAYLVDTNVLIYAYDDADAFKRDRAIDVLKFLRARRLGAISVQILGEFYVNVTRKPRDPLTLQEARATAIRLSRSWPVLDLNVRMHIDAIRAVAEHKLSYWDALIWAAARQNDVPFIITEDQQDGRLIEDIRYIDPFAADFALSRLS